MLILDMDPQGDVGKSLGIDIHSVEKTVFDLLLYLEVRAEDIMIPTRYKNLFVISANKLLNRCAGKHFYSCR